MVDQFNCEAIFMKSVSRRSFIRKASLAAGFASIQPSVALAEMANEGNAPLEVHIFSKHLQFLSYSETGKMATEMGFSGMDLTVRPKGHVLPEKVAEDLPKAVKEIQEAGGTCKMITTRISSATHPQDVAILTAAAALGIKYYRPDWFKYPEDLSMPAALDKYQRAIDSLGVLNKKLGVIGCYQNHAGRKVGASYWEVKKILETVDPLYFGAQYDIRHAMIEGGKSWKNGFELLRPHIKTIVLKDYKWGIVEGKWQVVNTPIGEGMVDFAAYFKLLKSHQLKPPVSLHLEYPLGGAEKGKKTLSVDKKVVFDAMKKDLAEIQRLWKEA